MALGRSGRPAFRPNIRSLVERRSTVTSEHANGAQMSQSTQAVALRCHQVEKIYPRENRLRLWRMLSGKGLTGEVIHALSGNALEVPLGKVVGVLGKNGAGKSTLLRILGGVYPPTRGTVETRGRIAGLLKLGGFGNR